MAFSAHRTRLRWQGRLGAKPDEPNPSYWSERGDSGHTYRFRISHRVVAGPGEFNEIVERALGDAHRRFRSWISDIVVAKRRRNEARTAGVLAVRCDIGRRCRH